MDQDTEKTVVLLDSNHNGRLSSATVGFDVGATTTRVCLCSNGSFVKLIQPKGVGLKGVGSRSLKLKDKYTYTLNTPSKYLFQTRHRRTPPASVLQRLLVHCLSSLVLFLVKRYPSLAIRDIAIAFAGPIESQRDGLVKNAPNVWGDGSFDLKHELTTELGRESGMEFNICVIVDDEAAGHRYLNRPDYTEGKTELHYLTVSSGHSGAKIIPATHEVTPYESGHRQVVSDPEDPLYLSCGCGGKGHLETLVSGRGAERLVLVLADQENYHSDYKKSPLASVDAHEVTTFDIVEAAKGGDKFALEVVGVSARNLVQYTILPILNNTAKPDGLRIVIGGGYARALGPEIYLWSVKDELKKSILGSPLSTLADEQIDDLLVMGIDDDYDPLHGVVLAVGTACPEADKRWDQR